jgi:hypothetical protein
MASGRAPAVLNWFNAFLPAPYVATMGRRVKARSRFCLAGHGNLALDAKGD